MSIVPVAVNSPLSGAYEPTICKRVEYGPGSLSKLPDILDMLGINKAFLVTGKSLATKTDVIEQIKRIAATDGKAQVTHVFHEIAAHAPIQDIKRGVGILREKDCDGIVAVGGGSPIDSGKVMILEYMKGTAKVLPMVSIPTTLSAAENSAIAGYTNEEGKKTGTAGRELTSSAIIYDAQLAMSTPLHLWLSTGIRALDHAMEQQIRPNASVPIRALCREAALTLFHSLSSSKRNPDSVEARQQAFDAAWLSLFSDNEIGQLGLSHTLGYLLGAPYGIPHGICSVLTLPGVMRVYAKHLDGEKLKQIASILPFVDPEAAKKLIDEKDTTEMGRKRVMAVANAIQRLCEELDLKPTLREYKVSEGDLEGIARNSVAQFGESYKPMYEDILNELKSVY